METIAYIGTYTKKDSKGIYKVTLNEQGKVINVENVAAASNPTYLNLSSDEKMLFSVDKVEDKGAISSFKVKNDNSLTKVDTIAKEGNPTCYVEVSKDNKYLVAANYHMGTIDSYKINEDGTLTAVDSVQHVGHGTHPRQEKSHAHFSGFSKDGRFFLTCDLGTDAITTYKLNDGKIEKVSEFIAKSECGVRHLVFTKDEKFIFVMTELSAEVIALDYDKETGRVSNPKYYPTLPEDFSGANKGSAIRISNDDKFIYVTNRGQDAIVIFENNDGELTHIDTISSFGQDPRDFNLSKTNDFAIAANETSGTIATYKVDKNSGKLTVIDEKIIVPEAVCVQFVD